MSIYSRRHSNRIRYSWDQAQFFLTFHPNFLCWLKWLQPLKTSPPTMLIYSLRTLKTFVFFFLNNYETESFLLNLYCEMKSQNIFQRISIPIKLSKIIHFYIKFDYCEGWSSANKVKTTNIPRSIIFYWILFNSLFPMLHFIKYLLYKFNEIYTICLNCC